MGYYKMKAWDGMNKVMHYDFEYINIGEGGLLFQSDIQKFDFKNWPPSLDYEYGYIFPLRCLYFTDNNGKDLYESDLVKVRVGDGETVIGVCVFGENKYSGIYTLPSPTTNMVWFICYFNDENTYVESIGSSFEHPEICPTPIIEK